MTRWILITGSGGFVGPHLMARLRRDHPDASLHAMAADITNSAAIAEEVRTLRPDACIHMAAISAVAQASRAPEQAWNVNLLGTLNLASAVKAHAPECLFVFTSSAEIYGHSFRTGQPLNENAVPAPLNTYAATKAAADLALGALSAEGLRCVRLRSFNHTGPGQSDAFVVAAFARQVALIALGRQAPVLRVGALDPARDFLDVRDVCAAYSACIARANSIEAGTILNIASGTPRKIGDVLQALLDAAQIHVDIEPDPTRMRPNDIPLACGDASRAREVLNWLPEIPWEQTIGDVLEDWRNRITTD
jgi:GDP-4-dehydro-6-deoxy-D-mannose reductase